MRETLGKETVVWLFVRFTAPLPSLSPAFLFQFIQGSFSSEQSCLT